MDELIEELREELHRAMDGQDQELRLKISMALDEAILEYIRGKEKNIK